MLIGITLLLALVQNFRNRHAIYGMAVVQGLATSRIAS
jgi:hypothetical protein